MSLHDRLTALAQAFTFELLRAVRAAPLAELSSVGAPASTAQRAPRRPAPRRSHLPTREPKPPAELMQVGLRAFLEASPTGVSAGEICAALDLSRGHFNAQMRIARERGVVRMTGDRGTARYFAAS